MPPEISFATEDEIREIQLGKRLRTFNYGLIGEYPEGQGIWLNAKNEEGQVIGGFRGEVHFHWLFINILFVEETERGKGLGTQLLLCGENVAKEKGATDARLETFAWQAPQFYLKHGYTEKMRFENYFRDQDLYTMVKNLA
jgi:GNAT superfamily N-acetyltransferase